MDCFELNVNLPRKRFYKRFSGPSNWSEVSEKQGIGLMRLRRQAEANPAAFFPALKLLYGLSPRYQRWFFDVNYLRRQGVSAQDQLLFLEQGQNLLQRLDWIGQVDPSLSFPAHFCRFDYQFGTPRIWVKQLLNRTLYVGPAAGLGDCSFSEFMAADKAHKESNLPLLTAILYRPASPTGERSAFRHSEAKERSIAFASLDKTILERVQFGFGCTLLRLSNLFKYVFPKSLSSPDEAKKNSGTWLDVAIGMAKLDATKVADIEAVNVYLALKVLNEQLHQAEELEQQLEKMKTR